jgi:hypothetical protein
VVCSNATTLWHFDAAEWAPSTASKCENLIRYAALNEADLNEACRHFAGPMNERGELNELEAAQVLGTCRMTVHRLIKRGILKAQQACQGAPWVIKTEALAAIKIGPRGHPVPSNLDQQTLQF